MSTVNNLNTTRPMVNNTVSIPIEYLMEFFTNSIVVVRFYQIGYFITFLLGFVGNTASLITFSRAKLRRSSTGSLFIALAISDTLFLLISIFDFLEFGWQVRYYPYVKYNELCRFRAFTMNVAQVSSSWILVTISIDRWIRTRFPFKSVLLCTPKTAIITITILIVIIIGLYSQMLTPLFGMLIPGFSILACGPMINSGDYFLFFIFYWSIVQILILCLIPVTIMIVVLIDIYIIVRLRKRATVDPEQEQRRDKRTNQQKHFQLQMLVLMLTSISVFLLTTLPVSIYRIISPREPNVTSSLIRVASIWIGLAWFQSLNYAVNFYVHCLTSTLFRKEFRRQLSWFLSKDAGQPVSQSLELTAPGNRTRF